MASKLPTRPIHQKGPAQQPRTRKRKRERRRAREKAGHHKDATHLDHIRILPCCIPTCGRRSTTEAAHVRSPSARFAKVEGIGMKPSDSWTVPLCAEHHRLLPDSQHAIGERKFWHLHGINPFVLALALWEASGDMDRMLLIVQRAPDYGTATNS